MAVHRVPANFIAVVIFLAAAALAGCSTAPEGSESWIRLPCDSGNGVASDPIPLLPAFDRPAEDLAADFAVALGDPLQRDLASQGGQVAGVTKSGAMVSVVRDSTRFDLGYLADHALPARHPDLTDVLLAIGLPAGSFNVTAIDYGALDVRQEIAWHDAGPLGPESLGELRSENLTHKMTMVELHAGHDASNIVALNASLLAAAADLFETCHAASDGRGELGSAKGAKAVFVADRLGLEVTYPRGQGTPGQHVGGGYRHGCGPPGEDIVVVDAQTAAVLSWQASSAPPCL